MDYSSLINGKSFLVTGGTGSFGYQIVSELLKHKPKDIRIYSRDEDKQRIMMERLPEGRKSQKIHFIIGDVRDYDRLYSVCKNVDYVFHAAALKQVPAVETHPYEAVKTNILGTYNVIKATVARKVKKVVSISTDKAVKPVNAMGMTKALQEKILISDDLEKDGTIFCCVRYGNVLGSRGSVIPVWDTKLSKQEPLLITHPKMTRFMLTLQGSINLVLYALKNSKGGEIFVKKSPSTKIVDLAKAYAELKTGKINYPLKFIGIRAGEKLDEVLVSKEEMRHTEIKKEHFVIKRERKIDKSSLKNDLKFTDYKSSSVKLLSVSDLKRMMKHMKWVE